MKFGQDRLPWRSLAIAGICLVGLRAGVAAADELLVTDRATDRILAFDAATGALTRVVVDEGLSIPSGLAFGPDGLLYVSNLGTGEVLKVDPETGAASPYAIIGGPGGLAYDPASDTMFVSEFGNFNGDEVYQFDAAGGLVRTIGTGSGGTGRAGLAIYNGDLYVSSFAGEGFFSGSVLKFDGSNDFAPLGTVASDPRLGGANGLAFDASGRLYVAGLFTQAVLGPEGVPVFRFDVSGGPATAGEQFGVSMAYPSGVLARDEEGAEVIYVTSLGNDNPQDPTYGANFFPGAIYKFDAATGSLIGGAPLISSGGVSDHDDDGVVDGADLAKWQSAFGVDVAGDADSDGDSDGTDFLKWQQNAGRLGDFQPTAVVTYSPPMAIAVPELSAGWLAVVAFAGSAPLGARSR